MKISNLLQGKNLSITYFFTEISFIKTTNTFLVCHFLSFKITSFQLISFSVVFRIQMRSFSSTYSFSFFFISLFFSHFLQLTALAVFYLNNHIYGLFQKWKIDVEQQHCCTVELAFQITRTEEAIGSRLVLIYRLLPFPD